MSTPALSPLSLLCNWCQISFPKGKARPGRDADHSPQSRTVVENEHSSLHMVTLGFVTMLQGVFKCANYFIAVSFPQLSRSVVPTGNAMIWAHHGSHSHDQLLTLDV